MAARDGNCAVCLLPRSRLGGALGALGGRLGALISEWRAVAERGGGAGQCVDIVVCDDVHCQHSGDGLNSR